MDQVRAGRPRCSSARCRPAGAGGIPHRIPKYGGDTLRGIHPLGRAQCLLQPVSVNRQQVAVAKGFDFGCVRVGPHAEGLQVHFQYDSGNVGAPDRWFFNRDSGYGETPGRTLIVREGEWVRVYHNGRFDHETGDWWYQQVTVNVAWFGGAPDGRIFLDIASRPTKSGAGRSLVERTAEPKTLIPAPNPAGHTPLPRRHGPLYYHRYPPM